jgi:hypothetical protein
MINKVKKAFKALMFIIILLIIVNLLSYILVRKDITGDYRSTTTVANFYNEPKNTIEVLFIGSSFISHGISPMTIWDEYGIPSYSLALEWQMPITSHFFLEEALKHQQPKVVVLGTSGFMQDFNYDEKDHIFKQSLDFVPLSISKLKHIIEIVINSEEQKIFDYLFPLEAHHHRWDSLKPHDFKSVINELAPKGADISYRLGTLELQEGYMENDSNDTFVIDELNQEYLLNIIDECKSKNIELVVVSIPNIKWNYNKSEAMKKILDENEIPFIDYNDPDLFHKIGLNVDSTSYDGIHLNIYGAEKISRHLADFLINQYSLSNKKDNDLYKQWEEVVDHYNQERNLYPK